MATFTVKLSNLIQEDFDFGLTDYPIFDETYRDSLNKKILDHYWNYEIGQETESMFRFSLNRKMREIMPFYNQVYKSTQIEFDPLQTMKYTDISNNVHEDSTTGTNAEEGTAESIAAGTETNEGDTTSSTLGKSRSVSSVTPQVQLSGNEDYAASAADVNSDSNVVGNSSNASTSDLTNNAQHTNSSNSSLNSDGTATIEREVTGSQGVASELLMLYRATFLNIDMQIISDLESLFMQIWDNGDEFTSNSNSNWSFSYGIGLF